MRHLLIALLLLGACATGPSRLEDAPGSGAGGGSSRDEEPGLAGEVSVLSEISPEARVPNPGFGPPNPVTTRSREWSSGVRQSVVWLAPDTVQFVRTHTQTSSDVTTDEGYSSLLYSGGTELSYSNDSTLVTEIFTLTLGPDGRAHIDVRVTRNRQSTKRGPESGAK